MTRGRASRPPPPRDPVMEVAAISNQLTTARAHAASSEYRSSIVYYEGVLDQLSRYVRTLNDPYATSKWLEANKRLQAEAELVRAMQPCMDRPISSDNAMYPQTQVKELNREIQAIGNSAGPGPGSALGPASGGAMNRGWGSEVSLRLRRS